MGSRWLYMLPAILLSVLAVILALVGLARMPDPDQQQGTGTVIQVVEEREPTLRYEYWVGTRELPVGTTMRDEDLARIAVSVPLADAVTADTNMAGQLLRRNLRKGEVLARTHLEAGNQLARAVPAGYRAFAIPIDDVVAAGGLLKPGDLVDVLASFRTGQDAQPTAMILLSSIEVLAVNGQLDGVDAAQENAPQQRSSRNSSAVLAVPRDDLTRLLVASDNGSLRLAVAGEARFDADKDGDTAPAATTDNKSDVMKLDSLFPKPQRAAPTARPGERVEVIEGSSSRSTYVH